MKVLRSPSSNRFCGPAALAALAGVHVDDAARALRHVSGRRAIKGIGTRHMTEALALFGHWALPVPCAGKPTLTQALAGALRQRKPDERYLVFITRHYVVIQGRKLIDNKHPGGRLAGRVPLPPQARARHLGGTSRARRALAGAAPPGHDGSGIPQSPGRAGSPGDGRPLRGRARGLPLSL